MKTEPVFAFQPVGYFFDSVLVCIAAHLKVSFFILWRLWIVSWHIFEHLASSSSLSKKDFIYVFFFNHAYSFLQPVKRKKEGEERRMTQEEMLLEAAETGWASDCLHIF